MPKIRPHSPTPEQVFMQNKWDALLTLARKSGFDDDAIVYTEFCLMPFFELIVEECAKVAEQQGSTFTGENNESVGCTSAANAIRTFGKKLGNYEK